MKEVIANQNDSLSVKSLQGPGCASLLLRAEYGEYLDNYIGQAHAKDWCLLVQEPDHGGGEGEGAEDREPDLGLEHLQELEQGPRDDGLVGEVIDISYGDICVYCMYLPCGG